VVRLSQPALLTTTLLTAGSSELEKLAAIMPRSASEPELLVVTLKLAVASNVTLTVGGFGL